MFDTLLPEKSILPAHPWANMAGRRNKKRFYICSVVIDSITDANSGCLGRGLGRFRCGLRWFGANMAGQCNILNADKNIFWVLRKWFGVFPQTLTSRIIFHKKYFLSS